MRPRFRSPRLHTAGALLAWAALLATGPARADDLIELYNAARAFDASYLAARAQAESAEYRTAQAYALLRPSVGVDASSTRTETDPPSSVNGGNRLGATTNVATLSARQPLFNRASSVTIDQAEKALVFARSELESVEQELVIRVARAYFDVLGAQDTLEFSRTSKAAIAEQLASAKRNFEVGTATITDTREAQARYDLSTANEIAAENDLRTRRIVLDQLVGRSNVVPNPLAVPVKLPPVLPADAEQWVARAWAEHPLIDRAQLALDIARLETDKAKAGHLPTVDLVGSYGGQHADGRLANLQGTSSTGSVGVQLNLPIFSGFAVQNRVKETVSLEEKSRNDLEASRRDVATFTRTAYFTVLSGQAQVQALEAAEASTTLALEATQLGYKVGVRVNIDVLNAQTQLFLTKRDLSRARYDVLLNSLRLRQAAGVLTVADLSATNTLVAH